MYKCGGNFPILESQRLRLRKLDHTDAQTLFGYWTDPRVIQYMNMPFFTAEEDIGSLIHLLNDLSKSEENLRWGIELKQTKELIGSCGFNEWMMSGAYRGEIGYELGRVYWGQGYMTEALGMVLAYGFGTMGLNRVEALVHPRNAKSQRLLHGLGFAREGLLREYQKTECGYEDLLIYSLLKKEYE